VGASPDNNPIAEDALFNLDHINIPYIQTKRMAEKMVMEANGPHLETITLNPSIMISIPDRELTKGDLKKIPRLMPIYFDFGLNLVETDDVITGIIASIDKGTPGQRYLLTGDNIDTDRAVSLAIKYLNIGRPFLKIPRWLLFPGAWIVEMRAKFRKKRPSFHRGLAKLAYYRFYYSNEKAKRELGYNPKPLEDTVVRIINVLKSRNEFRPQAVD
jgi:dihydroflavonol-4-reductase